MYNIVNEFNQQQRDHTKQQYDRIVEIETSKANSKRVFDSLRVKDLVRC